MSKKVNLTPPPVLGIDLDHQTRCHHWHSLKDVIAIKMYCCDNYYACYDCHTALTNHPVQVWPKEKWDRPAILCGICHAELSIQTYLNCDHHCPTCDAAFNPGCHRHYHLYFER